MDTYHGFFFSWLTAINNTPVVKTHETRLHDINTLDWDELLVQSDLDNQSAPIVGKLFEY